VPEFKDADGNVLFTFSATVGLDLVPWPGGAPAGFATGAQVLAGQPTLLVAKGPKLNFLTAPGTSTDVSVVRVG
jgi:hypothetical protein